MSSHFYCKNKDRRKIVDGSTTINGIDYLEVASPNQLELKLFFLHDLPDGAGGGVPSSGSKLNKNNIFIEGGVRVKGIKVKEATTDSLNKKCLNISVNDAGDFSVYTLKVGRSSTSKDISPEGFDLQLSSVEFSFKINCPNEFDCKSETECPPVHVDEPSIDYLAKDFSSFKKLMLDRLSIIMPDWKERHGADLQIALIELLAYVGDHLSYYQDAVATEAYLHTARRRISLKRHARLLDYYVHDGCNARVWVQVQLDKKGGADVVELKKGALLMTNGNDGEPVISVEDITKFLAGKDPVVFEAMHNIKMNSAHNLISFYTWGDTDCCLPKGATKATLLDHVSSPSASHPGPQSLSLNKGDVLVLEELYSPISGSKSDADLSHRHAVRLKSVEPGIDPLTNTSFLNIEWYEKDALPFALCLTNPKENIYGDGDENSSLNPNEKSVARGNIVLADHGVTIKDKALYPAAVVEDENYYPRLPNRNNTFAVEYKDETARLTAASLLIKQDPHMALPAVSVNYNQEIWKPQKELLGSDRFAAEFVLEAEQDGESYLRFGNDVLGKKPGNGFQPLVTYRTGNGNSGNVGAESINVIEWNGPGIIRVRNPMPASGGTDPETMEEVRQFAPQAFRKQERAVTSADYVEKTELHPEVQKAAAKFYWTGSWYTVYIIVDRKGGLDVNDEFKESVRKHLEQYRMAGYDLEMRAPRYVPLFISLNVCVKIGFIKAEIKKRLLQVFSKYQIGDVKRGFFHPDNFTFGQPVYLSAIYKTAMEIEGVASVSIGEFRRWSQRQGEEIKNGLFMPSELEVIRLDNDPNFPENGKIDFIMSGGL